MKKVQSPKGYNRPGYSWNNSLRTFARTGQMPIVEDGSGHRAGEGWGDQNNIDPYSLQRRYNKNNSSSFDEGVWLSKQKRRKQDKQSPRFKMAQNLTAGASVIPYQNTNPAGSYPNRMKKIIAGKMQKVKAPLKTKA